MKTKFLVDGCYGDYYETYDEAVVAAKKRAEENRNDTTVYEAVAQIKFPVPDYDVVKL